MSELPSGTVTFLFTDLERSTPLWEEFPDAMGPALERHDEILRHTVAVHHGHVVKTAGDGLHAVFANAQDALAAAADAQLALHAEAWEPVGALRVRMGLHTCEADLRDGDYYGSAVNRAARLMSIAHGGQVVVSAATAELARESTFELRDLGEHRLAGLSRPERVSQLCPVGLAQEYPPLRSVDAMPGNLPREITTFIGREVEIASLAELVERSSLVTLTGVGGVGKTRLALQVAAHVVAEFPDGAWLCELAPVTDPEAVWETLATALHVQPLPGRALDESVLDYLAAKRLLVVLDNCEHLLDAVARVVDAIERRCAGVSVLATSREGLGVAGERMVAVPSLGVPVDDASIVELRDAEAVCLFSDRATAAKSDFALTDRNVGAVGVLCRRLDGIPLAIELAAARVRSMSPDDLVARLDQRFKLLTHGSRAALERHQTLRSTIDWSYDLLMPTERVALNRLSVFAGGCDLAAAEAVLPADDLDALDVVDVLGQLVDKSLVAVDDADAGVRYRLLETIRQYAREQLDASDDPVAVRRRHADYYVALAQAACPHLRGREHLEWTGVVARDVDNFRAALDWSVETGSKEHALRLVAALALQGRTGELVMDWAATAIAIPGAEVHPLLPVVAAWAAWGATLRTDLELAEELLGAAERAQVALDRRCPEVARARATLAVFLRSDPQEAARHAADWVELARASGDEYELAHALIMLATMLQTTDPTPDVAIATAEEAVRIGRAGGIDTALIFALGMLSFQLPRDESERANAMVDEMMEISSRLGDRMGVSTATWSKALLAARAEDWRAALQQGVDAAEQKLELGDHVFAVPCFYAGGLALCALGCVEPAAVVFGKADAMAEPFGPDWLQEMLAATHDALREQLDEEQVSALAARGAALDVTEAVAYLRAEADRVLGMR